jgi:RES domain-containing protein
VDVDPVVVNGVWWRHIPAGGDPLHRQLHASDGRWQTGRTVEGFYLGQESGTVSAEWYRYIAEQGIPPLLALPRDLWRWELRDVELADLSDRRRLDRVGLQQPLPGRGNWSPFQAVGDALFHLGWQGILAPSAARPEDLVVCLFRPEKSFAGIRPLPPPTHMDEPPSVPTGMRT